MARTMSDKQERGIRDEVNATAAAWGTDSLREQAGLGPRPITSTERLLAELDAERAAHEATRIGSYSAETMANMVEERDRLKARLALAEKWAAFGSACFDAFWSDGDPCDLDAGDTQERALEHGVLRHRTEGDDTLDVDANNCCGFCPCVTDNAPLSECECLFPTLAAWRAAK